MKVITGGIVHETSTFTPVKTTWHSFRDRFYLKGEEIIDTFRGTNTPIGGFIDGAEQHGFTLIPTIYAEAHPSAPTPRDIFDTMLNEMLRRIQAVGQIDGVLLELHGSMVVGNLEASDGLDDPEGYILTAIRAIVGDEVPILAQLDIHSNISPGMVTQADVLIGRETYPEIDMAERSHECVEVLVRIWKAGLKPTMALHQIPMVWGMNQVTTQPPMSEAIAELHRLEAQPGVVCASIATCYFLADVPEMGASVYVVTDNDQPLAQSYADQLGEWIFSRRTDWHFELPSTQAALKQADIAKKYPVIFADMRDNTGGGSPGDSTGMLQTFIEADLPKACILYIVDPEAIDQCHRAGVGTTLTLQVGGKSIPLQGQPVVMQAEVIALSDGYFIYDGPMYTGLAGNMGPSAYIRQGGVHVVLVSVGEQPYDTAFVRTLGLDPRRMRYIGVKSTAHFRAGFEAWAGNIFMVSEPSVHDLGNLPYHRLKRKLYPFDEV